MNNDAFVKNVASRLIEQIRNGTAPWQKPWRPGTSFLPFNPTNGTRYKGINVVNLLARGHSDARWMTYRQAQTKGYQVRRGEKGTQVQYWRFDEERKIKDSNGRPVIDANGEPHTEKVRLERPQVFIAYVFNAEQIEGVPPAPSRECSWSALADTEAQSKMRESVKEKKVQKKIPARVLCKIAFRIRWVVTIAMAVGLITRLPAETPQVVVQKGHSAPIQGLAFSPDGHTIVTCSWDHTVKFWDVATGCEFRTIDEGCRVNAIAFSPDGRSLALGLDDQTVAIVDPVTGERTRVIAPYGVIGIGFVAFSPDGKILALAAYQTVKLFDAHSWEELRTINSPEGITALRFSPDSSILALAEGSSGISLNETTSGKSLTHIAASTTIISSLAFSPDGKILAVPEGAADFAHPSPIGTIKSSRFSVILWDLVTQKPTKSLGSEEQPFASVDFDPLGKYLVSCSVPGRVVLWDVVKGEEASFRRAEGSEGMFSRAGQFSASHGVFSPDGSLIATANGNDIRIIEATSFKMLKDITPKSVPVTKVAFDSKHRCFATGSGSTVRIWSNLTGDQFRDFEVVAAVTGLQYSPDGKLLAIGTSNGTIYLEDLEHREERQLYGHIGYVFAIAFDASGALLATAGSDNRIILWDLRSGDKLFSSVVDAASEGTGLAYYTNSLVFASNGEKLISGHGWGSTDGAIFVWDTKTGTKVSTLEEKVNRVETLALSPDGKILISCGESDGIVMWNFDTGQKNRVIQDNSYTVAFAPSGKSFACADREGSVRIRNTDDGSIVRVLTGHTDSISSLAYNNDGTQLCTGSNDSTSRIWDTVSGQEIVALFGIADHGYVIVTPDGYYWASKDAPEGIAFRLGKRVYSAQQFDLRLNRPDIVLKRIGLAGPKVVEMYYQAHQMRLRLEELEEEPAAGFESAPILRVRTAVDRTTHDSIITLKLNAEDMHRRLLRFRILVNGIPISARLLPTIPSDNTGRADADVQIALGAGDNRVDCSVLNSDLVESLKQTIVVTCERPVKPKLFLVTAGVSGYMDPALRLVCAATDAQYLADFWRARSADYDDVTVVSLLDQDCTKEKILETKQTLMRSGVDDEIVLFFAGHGLLDSNNNYYFATYDIDKEHPEQRGLTFEAILSLLDGVESRKKLVLLDTCHAGEVEDDAYTKGVDSLFVHPGESTGTQVIASSGGTQSALEAKLPGNGAFMHALLECLKLTVARHARAQTSTDPDLTRNWSEDMKQYAKEKDAQESNVTVYALEQYLAARVPKLTHGLQTPVFRSENRQNDFMIFPW